MILDTLGWVLRKSYDENRVAESAYEEAEKAHQPWKDAARTVLRRGRSVNGAYGPDGALHLRRRARQVRRDFGAGFSWRAMRAGSEASAERIRARWRHRLPWWWV